MQWNQMQAHAELRYHSRPPPTPSIHVDSFRSPSPTNLLLNTHRHSSTDHLSQSLHLPSSLSPLHLSATSPHTSTETPLHHFPFSNHLPFRIIYPFTNRIPQAVLSITIPYPSPHSPYPSHHAPRRNTQSNDHIPRVLISSPTSYPRQTRIRSWLQAKVYGSRRKSHHKENEKTRKGVPTLWITSPADRSLRNSLAMR